MKEIILSSNAPAPIGPYSQAVKIGNLLFTAGQIGLDGKTGAMAETLETQTELALNNLKAVVEAAGAQLQDVVKTTLFLLDMADYDQVNTVYATFFTSHPPARSAVAVSQLPKNALFEIEAIVHLPEA